MEKNLMGSSLYAGRVEMIQLQLQFQPSSKLLSCPTLTFDSYWLLEYEFTETIISLTKKKIIFITSSRKSKKTKNSKNTKNSQIPEKNQYPFKKPKFLRKNHTTYLP